jgi:hypothetical protein
MGLSLTLSDSMPMPIADAARRLGICVVTVGHLNRREKGTSPLQRIMGAAAFHGVTRYIYFSGPDPDDGDKHSHVLVQQRGGNAPSVRYRTIAKRMTWDGETSSVVGIEWRGTSTATGQDAVDPKAYSDKTDECKAADTLREMLRERREIVKEAKEHLRDKGFDVGLPTSKLNWGRILHKAGAESKRFKGDKFYSCFLPAGRRG